jgi:tetratricopeptide (TPR) repeat protein
MAERLLGGLLGGEQETLEAERAETLAAAQAFASAVAAKLAGNDPGVARKTEEFLNDQAELLRVQKKQLEEEHELRIAHLRNQLREERVRWAGLRLRVAFQVFVALVATVLGAGFLVLLRDAFTSREVVVEPFDAPPALVAQGATGKVIAAGLLDELRRLQSATRTAASRRNLSNAWTGEIRLAVPEAGISFGELSRLLRARFGHDLHIEGEVVDTAEGGLALTVRGDGVPAKRFAGKAVDLGNLTGDAAEYVYAQSEPVLWAYYLTNHGRDDEALRFSRSVFASADNADRPYLLNTWGNATADLGRSREALELYLGALKLKPDFWIAHSNVMQAHWALGEEESAWIAGENLRHVAGGRPGRAPETYFQNFDVLTWNLGPWWDSTVADADATGGAGSSYIGTAAISLIDIAIRLHDLATAKITLQTLKPDPGDASVAIMGAFLRGRLAAESGDVAAAAREMETFGAADVDPAVLFNFPGYNCWIAPAEEAAGHPDKADAILNSAGTFVDCYRFRADILDGRGDWPGAQKAYAEAVALAPDLPAAYYSWGLALARHGDLAGADAKLQAAQKHGPGWADPLKVWGDVLAREGRTPEALAKYDQALKLAPNWTQLKDAHEALVKQKA